MSELNVSPPGITSTRITPSVPHDSDHSLAHQQSFGMFSFRQTEEDVIPWIAFLSPVQNDGPKFHLLYESRISSLSIAFKMWQQLG